MYSFFALLSLLPFTTASLPSPHSYHPLGNTIPPDARLGYTTPAGSVGLNQPPGYDSEVLLAGAENFMDAATTLTCP
jgi:hypothetical protein